MAPKSLIDHPDFATIEPWFFKRQTAKSSKRNPKYWVEVQNTIPLTELTTACAIEVACGNPFCRRTIHPIRRRSKRRMDGTRVYTQAYYVAVTCPPDVDKGCSRGDHATDALLKVADAVNLERIVRWRRAR